MNDHLPRYLLSTAQVQRTVQTIYIRATRHLFRIDLFVKFIPFFPRNLKNPLYGPFNIFLK